MAAQAIKIEEIFEKNPRLKREDVEQLREWAQKQPHLPEPMDRQLIAFIHSCYYSLEQAKTAMDNFFTSKTLAPELFDALEEDELRLTLSVGAQIILPKKTSDEWSVYLAKLLDFNSDNFNFNNSCNLMVQVVSLDTYFNGSPEGFIAILDAQGLNLGQVLKFHLPTMKKFLYILQNAAPLRIKQIHVINLNSFIDRIYSMLKPFIVLDLSNILFFHRTIDSLYKHVPKNLLPQEYGGEAGSIADIQQQIITKYLDHIDLVKYVSNQVVDETKRPGKPKTANNLFGLDGTFKKLDID